MRTFIAAAAAASATLIAGCSSGEPTDAGGTSTQTPTATTTSSTAPSATVKDFARVVAEHHAEWDTQVAETEADCLDPTETIGCSLGYTLLGMQGSTIQLSLSALHKKGAPGYVGEVPAEVQRLVQETEAAGLEVQSGVDAMKAALECTEPSNLECTPFLVDVEAAVSDLSGKLDAWQVYS